MILALDTATTTASLALYEPTDGVLLAEQTWQARRRQTEELLPVLADMLARLDLDQAAMTTLAVTTGPGSFTGVRIAISVVKGLALGLPKPPQLVGVPTLSVTAAPWLAVAQQGQAVAVWAYIQAGRGRYNWAIFPPGSLLHRPSADEHHVGNADRLEAELAAQAGPIWLVGETTQAIDEMVRRHAHVISVDAVSGLRRAGQLARLAALHSRRGNVDTVDTLRPLYLREAS